MFNRRTFSVIKRELHTHLISKSFIISTLLVPVFLFGIIGIQTFVASSGGDDGATIKIAAESDGIINSLESELGQQEFIKNGFYRVSYETVQADGINKFIEDNKSALLDEKLTGIIYIPASAEKDKQLSYYAKNPKNRNLLGKVDDFINNVLLNNYFEGRQLSGDDISFATKHVDFKEFKVSEDKEVKEEGYGNMIVSFVFIFLLYFSLILFGSSVMSSVIEEKSSRIVEVLLSSLNSNELLAGKILGTTITGFLQMAIWLLPVFLVVSTSIFMLPPEFNLSMGVPELLYFLFNYFIALVTFVGLYATVGSIFTNSQEAQSGAWPVLLLVMIPFFIAIGMISNPQNNVATIASMVPFAALIVMPARITVMDVPTWQFILSLVVDFATLLFIFQFAGKIYRIGILSTGKKPSWGEVVKWLKYKY